SITNAATGIIQSLSGNTTISNTTITDPTGSVYALNLTVGSGTIKGWIETDGHLGTLTQADLVNSFVTLTDGSHVTTVSGAQFANLFGTDLTATANGLFFNFGGAHGGFGTPYYAFEDTTGSVSAHPSTISLNIPGDPASPMWTSPISGNVEIAQL